jgi:hypothetical protein
VNLTFMPRRLWTVVALALMTGVLATAVLLAALSDSSTSPPTRPAGSTTSTAPDRAAATAGAAPSSGPTGTPTAGSLAVVPAGEMRTKAPVPITATAHFGTGLSLRVTRLEQVRGVAHGPGEVAGPAVRMTVRLTNRSTEGISLESVVLAVSYGADQTPASPLHGPGGRAFSGTLEPGASATARYVYAIPDAGRDRVRMVASYTGDAPAVALAGAVR